MKTAPVKTDRNNGSFSIISHDITPEGQEALSEGQFEKKMCDTLSRADVHAQSLGIDSYTYWGLYRLFPGHFLRQWNLTTAALMERLWCSLVHPRTQHLKSLFGANIVYLQQLQQVISNGGGRPQLLTHGCVYAYGAASQMGGTFSPQWREQRENLKLLTLTLTLFMIFLDYKKMSGWIFTIIGWLFSHTAATQLCSNTL